MPSPVATCALLLYCVFVGWTAFVIFRWVEIRRLTYNVYPNAFEFSMTLLLAVPLTIVHRICQKVMLPVAVMVVLKKDKWSRIVYESKLTRFGSAVFKFIFFIAFSAYSYWYALIDADWMPSVLFGTGSTKNCWGQGNAGDTQQPIGVHVERFYHIALAYHVSELAFQIIYERQKPDFVEMFTHHVTTCFLLVSSFYANFVRIGTLVLFVHYVSDIPVYGAKIFVDTSHKILTFLCLIGMLASWGYLRLYVFPAVIIRSTMLESSLERSILGDLAYYAFNVALSLLVCLHCYWYYLFLSMGYGYIFKGETKDRVANLSFMDAKTRAKLQKTQ